MKKKKTSRIKITLRRTKEMWSMHNPGVKPSNTVKLIKGEHFCCS